MASRSFHSCTPESKGVVQDEGGILLRYTCSLPVLPTRTRRAKRRMARYYRATAAAWKNRWETQCKEEGQALRASALAAGTRFQPGNMHLTSRALYASPSCVSILQDATETWGDGRPIVVRSAVTWDTEGGWPLSLRDFLPTEKNWQKRLLASVCEEGRRRIRSGEFLLDEPVEEVLIREFSPDRFFITPEGLFIFYPLCAVGPYWEGLPVFQVPSPLFPPFGPCIPAEKEL